MGCTLRTQRIMNTSSEGVGTATLSVTQKEQPERKSSHSHPSERRRFVQDALSSRSDKCCQLMVENSP